jgi:hypothetical protein
MPRRPGKSRLQNGDGDLCPLVDGHGYMQIIPGTNPPQQWCPHQTHDGVWDGNGKQPKSRSTWPLYGLDDTVASYMARLDRAIREASKAELEAMNGN